MENNLKIDRFLSLRDKLDKLKKLKTKTRYSLDREIRHRQDLSICNTLVKNLIAVINQIEVTRKQIEALDLENQPQIMALIQQSKKEQTIWCYDGANIEEVKK